MLTSGVSVSMTGPGTSDSGNSYTPSPGTIAAGTVVDSYLFHSDPVGSSQHTYDFTVTSSTPILGIIDTISGLADTDSSLGSPTTTYPGASTDRALEDPDSLKWIAPNTLELHMLTSEYVNEFRILVAPQSVPEPMSAIYAVTGAALLLGYARARGRRP